MYEKYQGKFKTKIYIHKCDISSWADESHVRLQDAGAAGIFCKWVCMHSCTLATRQQTITDYIFTVNITLKCIRFIHSLTYCVRPRNEILSASGISNYKNTDCAASATTNIGSLDWCGSCSLLTSHLNYNWIRKCFVEIIITVFCGC